MLAAAAASITRGAIRNNARITTQCGRVGISATMSQRRMRHGLAAWSTQRLGRQTTLAVQAQSPSHRPLLSLPIAHRSFTAASCALLAPHPLSGRFTAPVAPPRLVYELDPPNSVRRMSLLNGVQWVFWVGIYGLHFFMPEIPLWWGAIGLATSTAFGIAMHFRAKRTINELAVVRTTATTARGRSTNNEERQLE